MADSASTDKMCVKIDNLEDLLTLLQCPVCYNTMNNKIFPCRNGHNVCEKCKPQLTACPICRQEFLGGRNYLVEEVTRCLKYSCENAELGCQERFSLDQLITHRLTCLYRQYSCFAQDVQKECNWKGAFPDVKHHVLMHHANSVSTLKELLLCDKNYSNITEGHCDYFFLDLYNELFVYYYKREPSTGNLFFAVQFIGPNEIANRYQYKLKFENENQSKTMIVKCNTHTDDISLKDLQTSQSCIVLDYVTCMQFLRYNGTFQYFLSIRKN